MLCLSCRRVGREVVCASCRRTMLPAPDRVLPGGWQVRSAWVHERAARRLVHRLKYEAIPIAGVILAREMARLVPDDAGALVPVPRSRWRAIRYGIDPGREIARHLSMLTSVPVVEALAPPIVATHNAGRRRPDRHAPGLRRVSTVPARSVLVDDVVTTGATLTTAIEVLAVPVLGAITATVSL